jgi:uncharacterized membrane protein YphA (DoxX/SURF4 family)
MILNLKLTTTSTLPGIIRLMTGGIFVMTGLMKLLLTSYSSAWSMQLMEAKIPYYTFTFRLCLHWKSYWAVFY